MRRVRLAPMASRTATSRRRADARASRRLPTFAQASPSTRATASSISAKTELALLRWPDPGRKVESISPTLPPEVRAAA